MNVLFLTALPTLKACNSPYMQCYFKRFFVLHSLEVIFSFLIKQSRQKAIEIETAFFIPLGIPKIAHWIISFMLHISAIISPTNWYLYQWASGNISEVINENSLSAFTYLDDFSARGHFPLSLSLSLNDHDSSIRTFQHIWKSPVYMTIIRAMLSFSK